MKPTLTAAQCDEILMMRRYQDNIKVGNYNIIGSVFHAIYGVLVDVEGVEERMRLYEIANIPEGYGYKEMEK